MSAVIGQDGNGRIWFKSDDRLTDITDATEFWVDKYGILRKRWVLIASYVKRQSYYRDAQNMKGFVPAITEEVELGTYNSSTSASFALDEIMRLRGIKEIDLLKD